ncbi:hypothetical protein RHGRI_006716 [Rhododendron griersonianum]|uniref:Uncharacterized protein n=1 Tax=Rhododendron griersonianum TaxID=479676 RepID=A0AAV6KU77_9ERIC|nr:hypothetical protein RHGRI_006716 [Rhododendron griersonianum]
MVDYLMKNTNEPDILENDDRCAWLLRRLTHSEFYGVPEKSESNANHHNKGGTGDIENPATTNCCISGLAITTHNFFSFLF